MNIICVVTNNLLRLKVLIHNLPHLTDCKIIFATDPRLGDKRDEMKTIYPEAEIISALDILGEYSNQNLYNYALGYKMVLPWYIHQNYAFDKFIMTDDDIIITEKIKDLFNNINNPSAVSTSILGLSDKQGRIDNTLRKLAFEVNDISYGEQIPYVNGGHILFTNDMDFRDYIQRVDAFMDSDIVSEAISNQRNWLDFFMDEVFYSCLFKYYSRQYNDVYSIGEYINCQIFAVRNGVLEGIFNVIDKYAISHFAGLPDKVVYPQLIKKGYLKGDE